MRYQLLFGGTLAIAQMSWRDGVAVRVESRVQDLLLTFVSNFPCDKAQVLYTSAPPSADGVNTSLLTTQHTSGVVRTI